MKVIILKMKVAIKKLIVFIHVKNAARNPILNMIKNALNVKIIMFFKMETV